MPTTNNNLSDISSAIREYAQRAERFTAHETGVRMQRWRMPGIAKIALPRCEIPYVDDDESAIVIAAEEEERAAAVPPYRTRRRDNLRAPERLAR